MGPEKGARMPVKEPGERRPAGRKREETGPDPAEKGRFLYIIIIKYRRSGALPPLWYGPGRRGEKDARERIREQPGGRAGTAGKRRIAHKCASEKQKKDKYPA